MSNDQLETKLIHAASNPQIEHKTGAVNVPIYLSSTYHQEHFDTFGPYDYSRSGNPTRAALESTIAQLENGESGFAFASGIAAISASFMLLSAGDHALVSEDVYGGTYRFVTEVLPRFNITHSFVDMTDLEAVNHAMESNTKLLYMETPSNPCMDITDIKGVVAIAKENNCYTFLDNTFMSPLYQKPLNLDVEIVLHSATKFLSGHSDIIAGLAVTKDEELAQKLGFMQNSLGNMLGAQDSYHLIQGIKTLGARLHQSSEAANEIAAYLNEHDAIKTVYYPGLPSHKGHELHFSQAKSGGAVFSFELADDVSPKIFAESIRLPIFAVSLGAVESILSYPGTMSHAAMPKEEREKRGIGDGLFRLSVGLEHTEDLIQDLNQAIEKAKK